MFDNVELQAYHGDVVKSRSCVKRVDANELDRESG
jgi:hypothetical protein